MYSRTAQRFLAKLDKAEAKIILDKIEDAKADPYHFFKKMVSLPLFRMRVGDYRVIADLQDKIQVIAVIKIGHRKNVYE